MLILIATLFTHFALGSAFLTQPKTSHQLVKRDLHQLSKRGANGFSGRATFYDPGLGACGNTNSASDFIVALNAPQFTQSKMCGKKLKISFGNKVAFATVEDECPGCPWGGLDMSPSLFEHFASKDVGVFYMNWSLDDGSSEAAPPPPPPPSPSPPPPAPSPSPPPSPPPPPPSVHAPTSSPSDSKSTPSKSDDSPTSKKVTEPAHDQTDNTHQSQNNLPSAFTSSAQLHSWTATSTDKKSQSSSNTSPAEFGGAYILNDDQSLQPNSYDLGGNLDAINQLVISFGSLAATSANNALNKQT